MSHVSNRPKVARFVLVALVLLMAFAPAVLADAPDGERIPNGRIPTGAAVAAVEAAAAPLDAPTVVWVDDTGSDSNAGTQAAPFATIQKGIDTVAAGGTVNVMPGNYNETAAGRTAITLGGVYQFGLYFGVGKDGITVQGLKADGTPVASYQDAAAFVTTNATNNYGPSSVWVEADNITISGLNFEPNVAGLPNPEDNENKTIEVVGNNVTIKNCVFDLPYGYSAVYINDWRYDAVTPKSHVEQYTISGNSMSYGMSVDVASGAGYTGSAANRKITNNKFVAEPGSNWALVSFNGFIPSVGWFVDPVGGATITGNDFSGSTLYIRSRGTVDEASFDWASYWNGNTFDKAVMATTDGNPAHPRAFDYMSGTSLMNNTKRIGSVIQAQIDIAQAGDTVLVKAGSYAESVNVNKSLKLRGAVGGDFSAPVPTAATQAPGVWYTDRYAPAVFESYDFGGEKVLRHGVDVADFKGIGNFYATQGRKIDTNLSGPVQTVAVSLWLDSSMGAADQRNAGLWATTVDVGGAITNWPIMAFRNSSGVTPGFYGWNGAAYELIKATSTGDYNKWHTFQTVLTVGTGFQYLLDGQPTLSVSDPDAASIKDAILQVYNFGQTYEVYWDNFKVESATPTPFEPVVTGVMNITAADVEVTGLYLTNPGQTNAVVIANTAGNVKIANNRIQAVGSTSLASNVHAVLVNNGADQVTIANNAFRNLKASGKSVSAVGVLDSAADNASEGLVVKANTFTDIASDTKGAYGIIINNKIGAPGAQIKDNTLNGLSGGWTHAIGLEGPTANAVVTGNRCSALTSAGADKSCVFFEKNSGGATVAVTGNQFNGGGYYGVAIHPNDLPGGSNGLNYIVNAENNWWGSPCGPSVAGVNVSANVDYQPWWTDAAGTGTAEGDGAGGFLIPAGASAASQNAIIACGAGKTITYAGAPAAGGVVVNTDDVTIDLGGFEVGPGSSAYTINADNVVLQNGTLNGGSPKSTFPAVLVQPGANNFTLSKVEVKNWADGVQVAGAVTSLKIVNNFIHDNTDAGLQVDAAPTAGSVVTIEGNLFKANGGNGIESSVALKAEYNSWGHRNGPSAGDGASASVDADPWTFAETYIDMDPTTAGDQSVRNLTQTVPSWQPFDVEVRAEAVNVYGLTFKVSYNATELAFNGITWATGLPGSCYLLTGLAPNEIGYTCNWMSAWTTPTTGAIAKLNFTPTGAGLSIVGPWSTTLDLNHVTTVAGVQNGAAIYLNNVKLSAGETNPRDITDTNDGLVMITPIAGYTGFIDVQGRADDSGATLEIFSVSDLTGLKATTTSAKSGAYTTPTGSLLVVGSTYYFRVDKPLYVKTRALPAPNKQLSTAALTNLTQLVLKGGDADNSEDVDLPDATCIGWDYGTPSGWDCGTNSGSSDVNSDGKVDILDLTLMGGNYGIMASDWTP